MTSFYKQQYQIGNQNGFAYLLKGFSALKEQRLRAFVLVPLVVNIFLFSLAFYALVAQVEQWMHALTAWLPEVLHWLTYILWPLTLLVIVVVFSFVFTAVANFIASPFNALLSERLVALMKGETLDNNNSLIKEVIRMLAREWLKICYYLPKLILFGLLLFIPVLGAVLWFLFIAWILAIQYIDYPFDNARVPFRTMKIQLGQKKTLTFSFGIAVSLCSSIPIVNLLVMPAAVCGASLLWLEHFDQEPL